MKQTAVTSKDIAKALRISVSTVSRALRGVPEIHPSTRQAVTRLAKELDDQPNQLAKSLSRSRSRMIDVVYCRTGLAIAPNRPGRGQRVSRLRNESGLVS